MVFFARRGGMGLPLLMIGLLLLLGLLVGCGGGGGSSSGSSGPKTVTLTGTLQDKTTLYVLPNRTVTVQVNGVTITHGTTNAAGVFSIPSVPTTSVTLVFTDSNGAANGSIVENLSNGNGALGVILLDLSHVPPPPGS